MSRPAGRSIPRILTIDRVNQPVADYAAARPWAADGPSPPSPLDLYLLHLLIEFATSDVVAVDLACRATSGASTVALLSNSRVRKVVVDIAHRSSTPHGERVHESAARFVDAREPGRAESLQLVSETAEILDRLSESMAPGDSPLLLITAARIGNQEEDVASTFLDRFPNGLVVVAGVDRPGVDDVVETLLRSAREQRGVAIRFLRDASASLFDSNIAILARGETAPNRARRIAELFTSNYDFLTILRDSCLYAIERGARSTHGGAIGRSLASSSAVFTSPAAFEDATYSHRELREENERLTQELREAKAWVRKGNPLLIPVRKAVSFSRRHRSWIAPPGSFRERAARGMIQVGRKLRGV